MISHSFLDRGRLDSGLSPAGLVAATLAMVALAAFGNAVVSGQDDCSWDTQPSCVHASTNPCTYNTCRPVSDTCNASDQTTIWTKVVLPPPTWPRCTGVMFSFTSTCYEAPAQCGSTMHFYDENCWMPCEASGSWQACWGRGDGCG